MTDWTRTEVTRRLGLRLPIIQGPFGGGLSAVDLVAAVTEAGALGSFGVHHLGGPEIAATAAAIRKRTRGPFALNLWLPIDGSDDPQLTNEEFALHRYRLEPYFRELGVTLPQRPDRFAPPYGEQVEAVMAARPAVFSFVYGVPEEAVLRRCRDLGIVTIGAATTPAEALALEAGGVDMVVATGFEAGGHRVSFLRRPEESLTGTMALVPQIVDIQGSPVIAAGGIADGRGIVAALALGAQAVQIGTAFLACIESNAHPLHRQRLFGDDAGLTALTRVFSGRLARGIVNRLMQEMGTLGHQVAPYPVQNWLTGALKQAAQVRGRADLMPLWAGQGAPLLRHQHAAKLIAELESQVDHGVRRLASLTD